MLLVFTQRFNDQEGRKGLRGVYQDYIRECSQKLKADNPEMAPRVALAKARHMYLPQIHCLPILHWHGVVTICFSDHDHVTSTHANKRCGYSHDSNDAHKRCHVEAHGCTS
jgi:hypothetical protein